MTKQVTLTIDDVQVSVPAGTLIVDAAKKAGIDNPVFCYHPKMEPAGMCRMCLVEIGRPMIDRGSGQPVLDENGQPKMQFMPKLETACTNPVSEGMVVVGMSDKVESARKDILELLLTSHPLDCPVCDKGGECPLQNLTMAHGASDSRFLFDEKQNADKHYPLGDLIFLDRERCIQCARCIRFQDEIAGDNVLGFYQRGRRTDIVTFSDPGFDSYWSGNTTDICPVGALTTADFRFGARSWELKPAASICTHCPVGCNLTVNTRREAKSGGRMVIKRIMPRQNEGVNEIWICDKGRFGHHFTDSADRLTRPLSRMDGKLVETDWEPALDLIADSLENLQGGLLTLVSGRLPNEDLFNLKTLTESLGGAIGLYTHMGGGDLVAQFGLAPGSNLGEMGAGDTIVVIASDLEEEAPIWYLRLKAAAQRGATLVVANPRPTKLERYATHVVRYPYGGEIAALQGLDLSSAGNLAIFYGREGLSLQGSNALAGACAQRLAADGQLGEPNNGLVAVWPRANDQGAWDLGLKPVEDLAAAIQAADVVYIVAADPAGDLSNLHQILAERRKSPQALTIVQELFATKTAELADVVLPALAPTEREGTFTSGERRLQRFYPVTRPTGEARADIEIASHIGARLGIELQGRSASLVFPQVAAATPAYNGVTYPQLAKVHEQWPVVGRDDLYYGGTGYCNKQGLGVQLAPTGGDLPTRVTPATLPAGKLIAIPVTRLLDRGTMLQPSLVLEPRLTSPFIALNPADAEAQKATEGMTVNLTLAGDTTPAVVIIDPQVQPGYAWVPRSCGLPLVEPAPIEIHIAEAVVG